MTDNVIELAYDRFGCHVVQKAVEMISEPLKRKLISQFLKFSIQETVTHRFASHVWQRIFEIQWKNSPFTILYEAVTQALQEKWADIANNEHGSLVVQCLFMNAPTKEKELVTHEILSQVQMIATGK